MNSFLKLCVLTFALTRVSSIAAQTTLETVEIVGTDEAVRRSSTAAKVIIGRQDIEKYADTSIADVMRRVSGITVSGASGRGLEISMKGLGGGYTLILINGEPAPQGFSIESLTPSQIERIEISRVGTADQSARAIAGTINFVLRRTASAGTRDLKLRFGGYAANPEALAELILGGKSGDLSYGLSASLGRRSDDYVITTVRRLAAPDLQPIYSLAINTTEYYRNETLSLTPRITWQVNQRNTLSGEVFLQGRNGKWGGTDTQISNVGLANTYAFSTIDVKATDVSSRSRLNWVSKLESGAQFDAKIGFNTFTRRLRGDAFYYDLNSVLALTDIVTSRLRDTSINSTGKWRQPLGQNHTFATGWGIEQNKRYEARYQREASQTGRPVVDLDDVFNIKIGRYAAYAQDEWEISKDLSGYVGLRYEQVQTNTVTNGANAAGNTSGVLSPVAQILWRLPNESGSQVRLGFRRTYRAPSTTDLSPRRWVSTQNSPLTPDRRGDANLRPEIAWGLDLGFEYPITKAGQITVNVNARKVADLIQYAALLDAGLNRWVTAPINAGSAHTIGLEIDSRVSLKKLVPSYADVDIRASASLNRSRVNNLPGPNNTFARQSPWTLQLGADYRLAAVPVTLGSSLNINANQLTQVDQRRTFDRNAERGLDLYGLWRLSATNQLRLSINNALHPETLEYETFTDSSGIVYKNTTIKRNTTIRLSWDLKL